MSYQANDLKTLTPGRAYREKLGMYLSADKQEAIDLGLRELIYNAQDEYEATKKKNAFIKIVINTDIQEISVTDNMRGIPCAIRDDGINSLTAAFLIPHSGAKHQGEDSYSEAVGVNGQGAKIVCHTAKWLKVEVHRDNQVFFQSFHETDEGAVPDDDVKILGTAADGDTGTIITYIPSPSVYENAKINIPNLKKTLTTLSYFTKGFRIILIVDGERSEFYSEHGLTDGLDKNLRVHSKPLSFYKEYPDCKVELALQWNKTPGELKSYANNLYVRDGGVFMTGFKTSLTKAFNSLSKGSFTGEQIRKYLDGFVSVKVKNVQFSNQAKTSLANPEARTATSSAISEALKQFVQLYPDDFKSIVDILKKEEKAEKAAERARNSILNAAKEATNATKKKSVAAEKLADCRFHDEKSSLYITEGDSAAGSVKLARNSDFVAVMPIRGKIINALKNPIDEVLDNEEVKAINKIMGCGLLDKINLSKLRYGKIFFAADADPDGYSIICLLLALFYRLWPELIEEGKVYWAQFPLYEVTVGNKIYFAYDDEELKKYPTGKVSRNKGLGEMDPDSFERAAFSDEARAIQFSMEDAIEADEIINILLGKENEKRTKYIFDNVDFKEVEGE